MHQWMNIPLKQEISSAYTARAAPFIQDGMKVKPGNL
jgi:hypothetical protein